MNNIPRNYNDFLALLEKNKIKINENYSFDDLDFLYEFPNTKLRNYL